MPDREKVIKGLEAHATASGCMKNCPYWRIETLNCSQELAADALALLEAQQPRVLTLEEVRSKQTKAIPVWKETKSKNRALYGGWVLAYEVQTGQGITGDCLGMAEPSGRMVWYKLSDYGKTWRVWSARPTDAQREVVKWGDDANPYI